MCVTSINLASNAYIIIMAFSINRLTKIHNLLYQLTLHVRLNKEYNDERVQSKRDEMRWDGCLSTNDSDKFKLIYIN